MKRYLLIILLILVVVSCENLKRCQLLYNTLTAYGDSAKYCYEINREYKERKCDNEPTVRRSFAIDQSTLPCYL
ncbi:hypothetical protein AKO1_014899 [Acrasis kona]|uniref:Lipoprotein n=1 Tax=Acrasis kona TaxID=1008807 RepID=A0AAW2Z165_9EUKA